MSPHARSEDLLVEQAAFGLFATLGWQTLSPLDEIFGAHRTFGRESVRVDCHAACDGADAGLSGIQANIATE